MSSCIVEVGVCTLHIYIITLFNMYGKISRVVKARIARVP